MDLSPEGAGRPGAPRYAGFWIRVFANVLDVLAIAAVNMALVIAMETWFMFHPRPLPPGVGSVSAGIHERTVETAIVWPAIFIVACWIWTGATPGKWICGLRIVDEPTGGRAGAWQCIGRYFMAAVALALAGIGYFWIAIDPRKQGWHDKIVRTLVVRVR